MSTRPTIKEQRRAIADAVRVIPDTNVYERWPNNFQLPAILIRPARRTLVTMSDGLVIGWELEVLVSAEDNETGQTELDEYLDEDGEYSVRAALEASPTLGGVVFNSNYLGWDKYGGRLGEAISFIGAICHLETYI